VNIDATIRNQGGAGTVIVWAEVMQDSKTLKKTKTIRLRSGESTTVTFRELNLLEDLSYRVLVEE